MSGREGDRATPWHEARRIAGTVASRGAARGVPLAEAIGHVLAEDMVARQSIPHFTSSAMDGWAVAGDAPWRLVEGPAFDGPAGAGSALPVVTGQLLPEGIRGVLRSEHGEVLDGMLRTNDAAQPGEPSPGKHVRMPAAEAERGTVVVAAGCVINPAHVALAAACALDELLVIERPRVAILLTGDEVDGSGMPAAGRVRDSFGPQLPAVLAAMGASVTAVARVGDELDATISAISAAALGARVIVTTGGTGKSGADFVRAALARLGARTEIPGIAMRPGGPTTLSVLPGGQFVVSLPGNPLAAFMGLFTVAVPLVATLAGRPTDDLERVRVGVDVPGVASATQLLPYTRAGGVATPTAWNGSAMMRGLAAAEGVLVVPPGGAISGSAIDALPLPW